MTVVFLLFLQPGARPLTGFQQVFYMEENVPFRQILGKVLFL